MSKSKGTDWKRKAIQRSQELKKLRKQLSEVRLSRQSWKAKYQQQQQAARTLTHQKPVGHTYPTSLIWLCLYVYNQCQCSLRTCCMLLHGSALLLRIQCRKPSATTIRNWVVKCGYYCYRQPPGRQESDRWCIILDESVSIGQEKLLVVLGVPLQGWAFHQPLAHKDVHVLHIGIAASWKAETIEPLLQQVSKKVSVSYCVSDRGNNLKAAVQRLNWPHIYDCSHQWANHLETCYGSNEAFDRLLKEMGSLRKKWVLSRYAHLMPPAQRTKSRFHNLFPLIGWIENIERCKEALEPQACQALSFLSNYRLLIAEWKAIKSLIGEMASILKTRGMNAGTLLLCQVALQRYCTTETTRHFSELLQQDWKAYAPLLQDETATYICCSDVIESWFGKFKQRIKPNGMQAITESVLAMSLWAQPLSQPLIATALQEVSLKKIADWKKENTTPSVLKKRTAFFTKNGTKKAA